MKRDYLKMENYPNLKENIETLLGDVQNLEHYKAWIYLE